MSTHVEPWLGVGVPLSKFVSTNFVSGCKGRYEGASKSFDRISVVLARTKLCNHDFTVKTLTCFAVKTLQSILFSQYLVHLRSKLMHFAIKYKRTKRCLLQRILENHAHKKFNMHITKFSTQNESTSGNKSLSVVLVIIIVVIWFLRGFACFWLRV